jgi:hypothetical protein
MYLQYSPLIHSTMRVYFPVLSLVVLLLLCINGPAAQAQTLKILSQRQNAYALNGRMYQNNTITVQCTDADFGVYRYATITKGDGSTVQLGVLCSPPVYSYELEEVGQVPRDARSETFAHCLTSDSLKVSTAMVNNLLDRTTADSTVIGSSLRRHKLVETNRHMLKPHRKLFLIDDAINFGVALGAAELYCKKIFGCAKAADVEELKGKVADLRIGAAEMRRDFGYLESNFTVLTNDYTRFFNTTNTRFDYVEATFNNQLNATRASLDFMNGTNALLLRQSQALQVRFDQLQTHADNTDTEIAGLSQSLASGISGVTAALSSFIAWQNNVTLAINQRVTNVSQISADQIVALRSQVFKLTTNIRYQVSRLQDQLRETEARRAVAAFMHQKLPFILADGYTPFTEDLGTAPTGNLDASVWRMLLETHRLMYTRDNLGLSAQMVDVSYFCDTQSIIDHVLSMTSDSDFFSNMGPVGCNATTRSSCACWITTQRSSCATDATRAANGTWMQNGTLLVGGSDAVCSGAITVQPAQTHTTLASFTSVMADVCNDGTYADAPNIVIVSGQLVRAASVPYNPTVCSMAFDTINNVAANNASFMWIMQSYLAISFKVVLNNANYYAKILYGQSPAGLTTAYDPLKVINGTEARCLFTSMVSYDTTSPLLPVYRLRFVSATSSVTVKLDGVVSDVVTDVSVSVPNDIILPATDTAVVGDPSDSSVIWNIPNEELSLSPIARAREYHVTYTMCTNISDFNVAAWEARNKDTFDHFAGSATAAYYMRIIDGSGFCTGNTLPGEGPWCTVRQDFAFSAAVGGFTLSPRTGTGAAVIGQIIIPDGSIASTIFSDCPSISIVQDNPGVATLTLSNARPDTDIVVAIMIGGQCSTTLPSFVIPALSQRDYLIQQCVSLVVSPRVVSVSRYDADSNLVQCGNTTNITISRDTFISTYSIPDLLHENITRQLSEDQTSLAIMDVINNQNAIIAGLIVAIPTAIQNTGIQMPNETIAALQDLISALQDQADAFAAAALNNRNSIVTNFTDLFNEFAPRLDDALQRGASSLDTSKEQLALLALENAAAAALFQKIVNDTAAAQIALAAALASIEGFANDTIAFAVETLNALKSMDAGDSFDLSPFSDFMSDVVSGVSKVGRGVYNAVVGVVEDVIHNAEKLYKLAKDLINGFFGIPGEIVKWILYIGIAVIGLSIIGAVAVALYRPQARKVAVGNLAHADLVASHDMTIEQAYCMVTEYEKALEMVRAHRTSGGTLPGTNTSAPVVGGATTGAPSVMSLPTMGWSNTAHKPKPATAHETRALLRRPSPARSAPPRPYVPGGDDL